MWARREHAPKWEVESHDFPSIGRSALLMTRSDRAPLRRRREPPRDDLLFPQRGVVSRLGFTPATIRASRSDRHLAQARSRLTPRRDQGKTGGRAKSCLS